MHDFKF